MNTAQPFEDLSFLITRDAYKNQTLSDEISKKGGRVFCWDSFYYQRVGFSTCNLSDFDWVVFTSARSVQFFFSSGVDKTQLQAAQFAVVGAQTEQALLEFGYVASVVASQQTSQGLAQEEVFHQGQPLNILLPHGEGARMDFVEALQSKHHIEAVCVYQKQEVSHTQSEFEELRLQNIDWILFYSPSAVEAFLKFSNQVPKEFLRPVKVAAIGPTTRECLNVYGITAAVVADEPSTISLLKAIEAYV